ncbi:colanic acid biosynthesis glycosyltransferase WcaL [filamentous cyanobacterium CCP1]|nr:colanic acid biosynthesis glycosyltransferase WcaL [filamentous cyanobacterium CCP2]PSB67921.1 colanic acid biosynthesis glycosyltransferase WcaL [filamentous cyanobacterium CCP1]
MTLIDKIKVGYILKRYPRYSETFVVSEILAHEAVGLNIQIFALHPPLDGHFQDIISRVRAPVKYLLSNDLRGSTLWKTLEETSDIIPNLWSKLEYARGEDIHRVYKALQLAGEVRRQGITHLHAHFATSATVVARLASHFADIPYSFTTHAKDIFHESVIPSEYQLKLQDAAAVVTVSDYNLNYLQQTYGTIADKVQRIYNGLDLQQFPYHSPQHCPPNILAVGRLVEKKGFSVLINACKVLRDQGAQFTCQIVGTGELEADLRHQIVELGLQDIVTLMGPRPQGELVQLMQSAAVFAAPCVVGSDCNRDGLPTVLLEAMALGVPCVSTDVTGIPEVLRHQETGLMVPQHNPIALAQAISQLLIDGELRVQLATQARKLIEQDFDIHRNTAHLRTVFRSASATTVAV